MVNLDDIEAQHRELFMDVNAGWPVLLQAGEQMTPAERVRYAETSYRLAQIHIAYGRHAPARLFLDACQQAYTGEKLGRVYLMYAQICANEHDYIGVQHFVEQVRAVSTQFSHLAECEFLLGIAAESDPGEALAHFDAAKALFSRARNTNTLAEADIARVSLKAAEKAFQINRRQLGWHYQRQAEQSARAMNHPDILSSVLLRNGQAFEEQGEYHRALEAYAEAESYALNSPARLADVNCYLGRLALWMNDDHTAKHALDQPVMVDHHYTNACNSLWNGWLAALQYDLAVARDKLEEVEVLMRDSLTLANQANVLRGLIAAQAGKVDERALFAVSKAVEFFTTHRMLLDASQAKLVLAWLYALRGDLTEVKKLVELVEEDIEQIRHAHHLARLYQASIAMLGGWWQPEVAAQMEGALASYHAGVGVRVYALGVPRVFIGRTEFQQRDRYGRMPLRLLIFMLEKRQAELLEITEALYPDSDFDTAQANFHTIRNSFKKRIGGLEWCTYSTEQRVYRVDPTFPHYYDGDDFQQTYKLLMKSPNSIQGVALSLKLITLYDEFAKTMNMEAFDRMRLEYDAQYSQMLYHTQEMLPDLRDLLPRHWYEKLITRIKVDTV